MVLSLLVVFCVARIRVTLNKLVDIANEVSSALNYVEKISFPNTSLLASTFEIWIVNNRENTFVRADESFCSHEAAVKKE